MRSGYDIVIADTSCLILLDKIGALHLLKSLFHQVVVTDIISIEFGVDLPEWIEIRKVKKSYSQSELDLDPGEASAIMLSLESERALLILDDAKARKTARNLNLTYTGTLGLFLKAKEDGLIPSVRSVVEKVQQTNFRYSGSNGRDITTGGRMKPVFLEV